jgi:hypothetical protein
MAYIGKEPIVGNFQVCDTISTSATATFNLLVSSVAVFPETENNVICSLNGVVQKPGSGGGFTISGSTIIFNSALTSADVIDFILILGNVLDIGTPSDGTVSTAKVADDAITTAKIPNDAITLAKMASGTDGNVISYDASGNPVAIATGSDGQVLTSTGAGSPPAFEALPAASSDWVKIKSQTASGSTSIEFKHGTADVVIDSTYVVYKLFYYNVIPASDGQILEMTYSTDAGSTYDAPTGVFHYLQGNASAISNDVPSYDAVGNISGLEIGNASGENCAGEVTIFNPSASTVNPLILFTGAGEKNNSKRTHVIGTARHGSNENIDAFKIAFASGNITSGVFVLYGIKGG